MKTLTKLLLTFAVLAAASPVWGSVDYDSRQDKLFILSQQALNAQDIDQICRKAVTPHQAAQKLRMAAMFSSHSISFSPYLHTLFYRLGQLTHRRDTQWRPETMTLCVKLMRYTALFRTLQEIPHSSGKAAVICALSALPENPCQTPLGIDLQPVWREASGRTLHKVLAILPRRALENVHFALANWQSSDGSSASIPTILQGVNYRLQNGVWSCFFTELPSRLVSGIEYLQLSIKVPDDLPSGTYIGKIKVYSSAGSMSDELAYTLKIEN